MSTRGYRIGVAALLVSAVAAGCGEQRESSFCEVYVSYLETVTPTLDADPTGVTAAEAEEAVEEAFDAARRVREVADSRYAAAVDALIELLDDLRRTLASFDDGEAYATWEPLVQDTIDDAVIAHERVVGLVGESCGTGA
jgi:hypothetical protein